jgi:hypothetical protein
MIANTISRVIVHLSRWSSSGNAAARPNSCPALPMSLRASPKYRDSIAHSKQISQSGALNHSIPAPQRLMPNHRAALKSP